MSKGLVECVHWDPEVDLARNTRKKGKLGTALAAAAVVLVAGVSCAVLFWPKEPTLDPSDFFDNGQAQQQTTQGDPTWPTAPPAAETDAELQQAILLYNSAQYDQSLAMLDNVLARSPESAQGYTYRGLCYFGKAEYGKAAAEFTKALMRTPDNPELYSLRGGAWCLADFYAEAIIDLTKAIELNPNNESAYSYRARAYEMTGQQALANTDNMIAESLRQTGGLSNEQQAQNGIVY